LDERLKTVKFDVKKYFERLSEKELDKIVNKDLNDALGLGLHELKNYVDYDLKLSKFDSDSAFWKLVGNPMYRIHEKAIVEKCRDSPSYKEKLFSKIEVMIKNFSNQ
jgi:hypothetical protein